MIPACMPDLACFSGSHGLGSIPAPKTLLLRYPRPWSRLHASPKNPVFHCLRFPRSRLHPSPKSPHYSPAHPSPSQPPGDLQEARHRPGVELMRHLDAVHRGRGLPCRYLRWWWWCVCACVYVWGCVGVGCVGVEYGPTENLRILRDI